ncbi:ESPR-type extended signal peptide-containing protein, partial [Paraburkholderia phosphatilytica]|uniref:ESPR-type extended signal peptide-containing protein n=1 Tax=Paraburkholderia phosphatilytica TaxID=2282883 RepID=UPI000E4F007D
MNRNAFRLVYSRLREMCVAVGETAAAMGKSSRGVTSKVQVVSAALLASAPAWCGAQIVPGGAYEPSVTQTANGLPQVNINRPSGAGVSMNTYGQFDVSNRGVILNNSPVVTQTQQAGYVNGNPNFSAGQSARVSSLYPVAVRQSRSNKNPAERRSELRLVVHAPLCGAAYLFLRICSSAFRECLQKSWRRRTGGLSWEIGKFKGFFDDATWS